MALMPPNLDDRTFDQLVAEAVERVRRTCPGWTDLSPGDPGIVLLELFAHLTETLIYRLNRLPDKAYVEFLRLMGVTLVPPAAARVRVRFTRAPATTGGATGGGAGTAASRIEIPRGTRVTLGRAGGGGEGPPVFHTVTSAIIEPGQASADVTAVNAEEVQDPPAVPRSAAGGPWLLARRPPIVDTGSGDDLVVGVETTPAEAGTAHLREMNGVVYRIWSRVETFADPSPDRHVYVADFVSGRVTFAPTVRVYGRRPDGESGDAAADEDAGGAAAAPLAEVPAPGRRVVLWYRRGGGPGGNVAAGTLTTMKDPIAGVTVTNPDRATGGREAQPLADALLAGPQRFHTLERAVTARDFELLAERGRAVARARAFHMPDVWAHGAAGAVQVLLVPDVPEVAPEHRGRNPITAEALRQRQTDEARQRVHDVLDERRPLGTRVGVDWVRHRVVRVRATIEVYPGEDARQIDRQVRTALNEWISPLPTRRQPHGWPFGQSLREDAVYSLIRAVPGVREVQSLAFVLPDSPGGSIRSIASDQYQPQTWHAISGNVLFRSMRDEQGWEHVASLPPLAAGEELQYVRAHRAKPGWVAVVTGVPADPAADPPLPAGSRLYVSADCGETWRAAGGTGFVLNDVAWVTRDGGPALLLAGDAGLFELSMAAGASLVELLVGDPQVRDGFWTVAVNHDVHGRPVNVAVAARSSHGVWLSYEGGRSRTFYNLALDGEDVRVLAFQDQGTRAPLWAGTYTFGRIAGHGCFRSDGLNAPWVPFRDGWVAEAGSCYGLTTSGTLVYAATHAAGVLRLDPMQPAPKWEAPRRDCGLPLDAGGQLLAPVRAVALSPDGRVLMAGTEEGGVYVSRDGARTWRPAARAEIEGAVALPPAALFTSGEHELTIVTGARGEG